MYFGLFIVSFVAATLVPFSSEASLTGALSLGYNPLFCIIVASLGNCSGAAFNYICGRRGVIWIVKKIFKFDEAKIAKYRDKFAAHSYLFLLSSWLPIVGDPITVYLGIVRTPFWKFALFVFGTRILRYIVVYIIYRMAV